MKKWKGFAAVAGLIVLLQGWMPATLAEDPASPDDEPAAAPDTAPATERTKHPFRLYLAVAGGMGDSDDLSTSIFADDLNAGLTSLTLEDQTYGRAAIGWRLSKGDVRLTFQGIREEEYSLSSRGVSNSLSGGTLVDITSGLAPWWFVDIDNGNLTAVRLVPMWNTAADALGDMDGKPDFGACSTTGTVMQCGEISYDTSSPTNTVTGSVPDNLQNRINTVDLTYGREFGRRRFTSQWFAGLRYSEYKGNLLGAAWLNLGAPGIGYTDGKFLRLMNLEQHTTGFGPTGSWEVDFNFFDRGLQLFVRGEVAFTFNSMELDSGPIFQVADISNGTLLQDRVQKDLDKSTWQDKLELGGRINLKNGLHFEAGYSRAGYLDFVLLPDLFQVGVTNEDPQTNTQDIVVDFFHIGAGFQF